MKHQGSHQNNLEFKIYIVSYVDMIMQFCLVCLLQFLAVLEQQILYYKILMLILTVLVQYERMYVQKNLMRMTKNN